MSHFSIFQLETQLQYAPLNADKQWKTSHIHPCPAVLSLYLKLWTPPSRSFSPPLLLMREKHIFEKETEEKDSPSSRQKCTTNNFLAYTQMKKNTTFTFTAMAEKVNVVWEKRLLHKGRERNWIATIEKSCSIFGFSWWKQTLHRSNSAQLGRIFDPGEHPK